MSHGDNIISEMTCRKQSLVKTGKKIENKTIKDLKVITGRDVLFSWKFEDLVLPDSIRAGLLLRTFK